VIWELRSGRELSTFNRRGSVMCGALTVTVTPDGQQLIAGAEGHLVKVWELGSGREVRTLKGHRDDVNGVAVTPDGQHVISASQDKTLKVWEPGSRLEPPPFKGHTDAVYGVAVTPGGQYLISASWDKTVKVWELRSGCEVRTLEGHTHGVNAVTVSRDGRHVLSASEDRTVKVWELESGRELRTLRGHDCGVDQVTMTPDGQQVVSATGFEVRVWDLTTGRKLRTIRSRGGFLRRKGGSIQVMPCGRYIVPKSRDGTVKVVDLGSERKVGVLREGKYGPYVAMVMPDGQRVVTLSGNELRVRELESGRELLALKGHTDGVRAVAVTSDGRRAVSASNDRTVRVWDMETGKVLSTFTCGSSVLCCAFADSSGTVIVAGDQGGSVHFLRLEEGKPKS
jgi:WD40 repeat protein